MKTGCQWRELSVREYIEAPKVSWQHIYYYFNKWSKDESFKAAWKALLSSHKQLLDLSCAQLDGSHTPAKRGGEQVGYQGRKACKTTNSLYLSDNNGQILSVGSPQSGEHNDLYEISSIFEKMISLLEEAGINSSGVFLNADPGFDSEELRKACDIKEIELNVKPNKRNGKTASEEYRYFDDQLYKRRTKIEHANAWLDAFKALSVRYETKVFTWMGLHWLALITLFCRKLKV
ncbi:transposase family protein [Chitinophaga sp. LS1]|nr:transposase family protein [Chitinophaga sp. LS1]WPV69207.1 transposase family protein [Chitinophaga sp. LS1]